MLIHFQWEFFFRALAACLVSMTLVIQLIPSVNRIARSKGLLNELNSRTSHRYQTPRLAGISVFFATVVSMFLFSTNQDLDTLRYLFLGLFIIFFSGFKDDIRSISPYSKLLIQILSAFLVVYSGIVITDLFGFLGIFELDVVAAALVTIICIVAIINAYNLIDGIDGCVSLLGVLHLFCFGAFFFVLGYINLAVICMAFIGALIAFFQYNVFGLRNKTFLGDSGSLTLGFVIAVCFVWFLKIHTIDDSSLLFQHPISIALSIIIIPVFDIGRVFFIRLLQGDSPFKPDRNHLHHHLIDVGLSHLQASLIFTAWNIILIALTLLISIRLGLGSLWIFIMLVTLMTLFTMVVNRLRKKKGHS
ncbi:undecaprenyl-phosphate alpha-N-acetylglucosaminyl 1-phosphate transferase [Bacteroidia bacterium]|nr:undecaprenyl-phosphate alpha-N-acetylglucosaminyl 1-phosphate transferase [Bacteroidia bacterium]